MSGAALVAVPAADAAPYPGTVATKASSSVPSSVKKNKTLVVKVRSRTTGNARVSGKVLIRVYRIKRGADPLVRSKTKSYGGSGYHTIGLGSFSKKGARYKTRAWFLPKNQSSVY